MRRQKTLTVNNEKIKIVSTARNGSMPSVVTYINGVRYFVNFEIMMDYKITDSNHKEVYEEFIERAMTRAYVAWVKEHT